MEKKKKIILIAIIVLIVGIAIGTGAYFFMRGKDKTEELDGKVKETKSEYRMSGNSLENFDLSFLKIENNNKNIVYSPLSIKYTLGMLSEGSRGNTKAQIDAAIGDYKSNKYVNSNYMSFANALFVRESFKSSILESYISSLKEKFDAEVIYDAFESPNAINNWVSQKTFKLINNLLDDVSEGQFYLVNSLAIDMEWVNLIQAAVGDKQNQINYWVTYEHEVGNSEYGPYSETIYPITEEQYRTLKFNDNSIDAKSVEIGASINNYDIISELGEENIRKIVREAYDEWLIENPDMPVDDLDAYLDKYIEEISANYKKVDYSTDFSLYVDNTVKVFAKDLQEYNGTTLEYVGIMPKDIKLDEYIKTVDADTINNYINNLKDVSNRENFTEGKVTKITGQIPLFNISYELDLNNDLAKMGITDIFDKEKIDISSITSEKGLFIDTKHKANIEFSNEGIKAAAVTVGGGAGNARGGFDYFFKIPIEEIDITFDKPYMYLIRDKKTGEIWFVGAVYEPIENTNVNN